MVVIDTINSVDKAKSLCGFTPNRRNITVPFETKSFFLLNTSTFKIYNGSTLTTKSIPQSTAVVTVPKSATMNQKVTVDPSIDIYFSSVTTKSLSRGF